jgi:protein-disulfide isomerase
MKQVFKFLCVLIFIILFIPLFVNASSKRYDIPLGDSPSVGPDKAPITIIEFIDYQWPHCNAVGPTVKKILENYKGKVRFIIKHYPYKYRDFAFISAEATLAARDQGKFWEMHWLIHERYPKLDRDSLIKHAQELGLNIKKFTKTLDKMRHLKRIKKDVQLAKDLDLYSTPAFFINGIKAVGNRPYESFQKIIDRELERISEQ